MDAIVHSNADRKELMARTILERNPRTVGVYRLVMKHGSDNFRSSSIQGVMQLLQEADVELVVFEPVLEDDTFEGARVERDLEAFKAGVDVILANRWDDEIRDVPDKVFSRDVFQMD